MGEKMMAFVTSKSAKRDEVNLNADGMIDFPAGSRLESEEQIRRFELLRLAFFGLKLRKIDHRLLNEPANADMPQEVRSELEFRRNLLRHAIYQQMVALIKLDAREQALQIIAACQN
jgi:hypothetical protein